MTTSTTVKNYQINLPQQIGRKLENKEVTLSDNGLVIILKIESKSSNSQKIRSSLKDIAGLLKDKNIHPLNYQKRSELLGVLGWKN